MDKRTCPECKTRFVPVRAHQVYDNPKCRYRAFKARELARIRDEVRAEVRSRR